MKFFFKLSIYIIFVSVLILLGTEFILRSLGFEYSSPHIMYDGKCYWRMAPRQIMHFKDVYGKPVTITINSIGSRGQEFSIEKPAGEKRIICVGDSYTYGWGVDDSNTYPAHLQKLMEKDHLNVRVINFGCNGHTILHELNLIKNYGLKFKPDYIIVATSLDTDFADIDNLEYNLGYMPAPGYNFIKYCIRKTAIGNILLKRWNSEKVKDIISRNRKAHKTNSKNVTRDISDNKAVFQNNTRVINGKSIFDIYIENLDELVTLGREEGLGIIFVIVPYHINGLDVFDIPGVYRNEGSMKTRDYYEFLKNRYGSEMVLVELMSHFKYQDLFLPDWHLNAKGNQLAAEIIYANIKEILKRQ